MGKAKCYKRKTLNEPRLAKGAKPVSVLPRASIPTKKTKEKKIYFFLVFVYSAFSFILTSQKNETNSELIFRSNCKLWKVTCCYRNKAAKQERRKWSSLW